MDGKMLIQGTGSCGAWMVNDLFTCGICIGMAQKKKWQANTTIIL